MLLRLRALWALALASAATLTPPRRLRYGIVGTGCIGLEHIRNLHLVDEAELVAIADPHAPSIEAARAVLSELSIDEAGVAICAGSGIGDCLQVNPGHPRQRKPLATRSVQP